MRKLRVTILDLLTKGPTRSVYARAMNPNLSSIMPQVIAVWYEALGHSVRFVCYTGLEDLHSELLDDTDILFVGAFTRSAFTAYAISNIYRRRGAVTVLGGPHARCYPQDAVRYFDYVLGLTDKTLIEDVLADASSQHPIGRQSGLAKVKHVSEHINLILRYVPYVQVNFVLGLDTDAGAEPFELTKRFLDLTPGAFPTFPLLTAFGQAAPFNLQLQREGRVLPFPFQFLDTNRAMNVRPKNYQWPEFYDRLINLTRYAFSWPKILRRFQTNRGTIPKCLNVLRAVSTGGFGRIKYHRKIRRLLDTDRDFRRFHEGEAGQLPHFYVKRVQRKLGPLWEWLPPGALVHDHHAYLRASEAAGSSPAVVNPSLVAEE